MNNDAPLVSEEKLWTVAEATDFDNRHSICDSIGQIIADNLRPREANALVDWHNASLALPKQEEREKLLEVLRDARATFMNLGIDNDTPMGLQLRKAAGRISKVLENETHVGNHRARGGFGFTAMKRPIPEPEPSDTERLDWLERRFRNHRNVFVLMHWNNDTVIEKSCPEQTFREAIDAAMKGAK